MAKVAAFHSSKNPGVYHECSNCTEGNNIESQHRKPGTGGGQLCSRCSQLQKDGKC